jgi:hypothetical protein
MHWMKNISMQGMEMVLRKITAEEDHSDANCFLLLVIR